jgi:hypothetical protein
MLFLSDSKGDSTWVLDVLLSAQGHGLRNSGLFPKTHQILPFNIKYIRISSTLSKYLSLTPHSPVLLTACFSAHCYCKMLLESVFRMLLPVHPWFHSNQAIFSSFSLKLLLRWLVTTIFLNVMLILCFHLIQCLRSKWHVRLFFSWNTFFTCFHEPMLS